MTNEEVIKKWEAVLDFNSKYVSPLKEEDRLKCAREMDEIEQGEGGYAYKTIMIPAIRRKYSGHPMVMENIKGKDYLITEENVVECIYEETPKGEMPKWEQVDREVKWYFPILEDKSDPPTNTHVFCRGYTDGIYHYTPKWGSSVV